MMRVPAPWNSGTQVDMTALRARVRWIAARRRLAVGMIVSALGWLATVQPGDAEGATKPTRMVSLNLCVDEILLRIAEPQHIASVTWLSRDADSSNVVALAERVPVNHGLAEEIIPLAPDLALAGTYTARTAVELLRRAGVRLREIGIAQNVADVRRQYLEIAAAIGEPERGEAVVAEIDRSLNALPPAPAGHRPRALVLNPNGVTVGPGTLADEIIARAGLENLASTMAIDNYGQIPLETVVANRVDLLIVSTSRDGPPALANEILRHPVLARLTDRTRVVTMPNRLWTCGGPGNAEAIARLMRAGEDVRARAALR